MTRYSREMASEEIVLYENLRACSYTPFYLAQLAGLFEAHGLHVDLRLSPSPPETAQGLIDRRADVSFGGPMRVMMHHDAARARGEASPLVCSAQIDVVQVFEPYAEALVSGGHGHVWHRFSARGDIAFTTFYTTRRFAAERRGASMALARAMAAVRRDAGQT